MKERLPRVTAERLISVLIRHGFSMKRQSGSHAIFMNPAGIRVTVPIHSGKIIHPKIIKAICNDAGIPYDEL
jgi:predicted RNA binding protein YcfA (HicA-like mRNA interferase family)